MKLFAFVIIGFVMACNGGKPTPEANNQNNASIPKTASDSLYKAVMAVHDSGMVKMGEMVRYQQLVKYQKDSAAALKLKNTVLLSALEAALNELNEADSLMNKWMRGFDPDKAGATEEEKIAFYSREKEKVDTVKLRMENSIKRAKTVTGN